MLPMPGFPRLASTAAACAILCAAADIAAGAESYPLKPIRMIVPAAPGGVTDIGARAIAPRLNQQLGQPLVVDNRAGAGGIIGTDTAAKAAPDGYTLLTVFDSFISNPFVFGNAPYDTQRDFAPVALLVRGPQWFVTHPKAGIRTLNELLALARSRSAPLSFATAGAATSSRLSVELFKSTAHITEVTLVHYKGGGPALTDLIGGHVDAMIASAGLVLPQVKNSRLIALAVTSRERSALAPGVPAVSEFVPHFEAQSWVGVLAPAATPKPVIERLNAELRRAIAEPEAREFLARQGYEIVGSSPAQFVRWIGDESAKWGKIIREQAITAE